MLQVLSVLDTQYHLSMRIYTEKMVNESLYSVRDSIWQAIKECLVLNKCLQDPASPIINLLTLSRKLGLRNSFYSPKNGQTLTLFSVEVFNSDLFARI